MKKPETLLPISAIRPEDGWCNAPEHIHYNRPVTFPFEASAEHLWREDSLYDLLLIPGFNDAPPKSDKGSAIFVHVAETNYGQTEGCIAFALKDLQTILRNADAGASLRIYSEAT